MDATEKCIEAYETCYFGNTGLKSDLLRLKVELEVKEMQIK